MQPKLNMPSGMPQTSPDSRGMRLDVWWRLMRPHTLTASFVPVLLGTAMALHDGHFHLTLFLSMFVASVLIQCATNIINEYYDYVRGLDTKESVGIGGTIVRDNVNPRHVFRIAMLFYGISLLLGVYICYASSWWVAAIGTLSILVSYLYSGGPLPISSTPLGELFSGLFMGPVIIMITYFIQAGGLPLDHLLVSLSVGVTIGAINMANNIRDRVQDKAGGRRTLPVLLGHDRAVRALAIFLAIAVVWLIALVLAGSATPWVLLGILGIPKAVQAVRSFRGKAKPAEMMPAMKATAQFNTLFGLLVTAGFLVQGLWNAWM